MKSILRYVKSIYTQDYLAYLPKDIHIESLLGEVADIMSWEIETPVSIQFEQKFLLGIYHKRTFFEKFLDLEADHIK